MDKKDIEMLLALYKEKNITKTSKKLYITQPALTNRIKKLEEEFNTPIVIRTTQGVIFTPQGEKLITHSKKLKIYMQNMKDDMNSTLDEVQGSLRLGVSNIFAHYELPKLLKGYLEKYPKVEVSIKTDHSFKIYKLLQSDEISVGVIRGDYKWTYNKDLLSNESFCLTYYKPISFDELLDIPYIRYKTDPFLQYQLNQWWSERYKKQPKVGITTSSINTCIELVKNSIGWSILPYMGLKNFDGYMQEIFWKDGTPFNRKTWLYYKKEYLQLPNVSAFVDYIQTYFSIS